VLVEYDGAGVMKKRYVHGPGIDEPLAMEKSGVAYYYHADGLGSITAMTNASGRAAQNYEYDAFGRLHDRMNAIKQPYAFTGREWDKETGLYYYRARYYDPETGRFTSKDPIGIGGGVKSPTETNLYLYAGNNPVNRTDPLGLYTTRYRLPGGTDFGPENCKYLPVGSLDRRVCENAGNNDFMNCSRKCLKDSYPGTCEETPPKSDPWYWWDHPRCWVGCIIYLLN
jgi:RHS repeat-associated protein